jgi:hypothetical protein
MFSRFHKILKLAVGLFLLLVAAAIGAPYLGADYFQNRIERALESALGRQVEIKKTHYSLFPGPGFTIEEVVIKEDPRIGIEPFAYAPEVDARIDLLSLFTGKMEFSSLRLVEPEINFARAADGAQAGAGAEAGVWNVQLFLDRAPAKTLPPITIRTGHVHVKFGDRKGVIYIGDTDADISPSSDGLVRVAVTGEAFRSDRQSQGLGRLAVRGNYRPGAGANPGKIDLDFELERSQVQDLVKLFDGRDLGLKGFVEAQAHLAGPVDQVTIRGQLKTSELGNRLFLPSGGSGPLQFEGKVNFVAAQAELSSVGGDSSPIAMKFAAINFLRDPDWSAELKLKELAVPAALEIAKNFGLTLPTGVDVQGKLEGSLRFSKTDGADGDFVLADPSIQLPGGGKLEGGALKFEVRGAGVALQLHTAAVERPAVEAAHSGLAAPTRPNPPASRFEVDGRYDLETKTLALGITSRGSRISETRKMFGALPVLEHFADGVWRGSLRYVAPPDGDAAWQGQVELLGAQVDIPGVADPVTVTFQASIDGPRAVVRSFKGKVGTIEFTGNYRYEPTVLRPHRVNLVIPAASLSEIERLLNPTLVRGGGLLARTLRFGRAPVPEWLRDRRIEGTIAFGMLEMGDWTWKSAQAKMQWAGTNVKFTSVAGSIEDAAVVGEGTVDLSGATPVYVASGKLGQLEYRGGQLDLKGTITSQGSGSQVIANAKAEGTFEASEIQFSVDNTFAHAAGIFELAFPGGVARTRLTSLEVSQGLETYLGQGGTQADGRFVLDLTSGPRQFKLIGALPGAPATQ